MNIDGMSLSEVYGLVDTDALAGAGSFAKLNDGVGFSRQPSPSPSPAASSKTKSEVTSFTQGGLVGPLPSSTSSAQPYVGTADVGRGSNQSGPAVSFAQDDALVTSFTTQGLADPWPSSSTSAQLPAETAIGGRGSSGQSGMAGSSAQNVTKAPGAEATTVAARDLWNSQLRWLLKSKAGKLKSFIHACVLQRASEANTPHTSKAVLPMPLPYRDDDYLKCSPKECSLRRGLNSAVLVLNWMHLGRPAKPPKDFQLCATLSKQQAEVVAHLRKCFLDWSESEPVTAAAMGRSAGTIESLEEQILALEREAVRLKDLLGSGKKPSSATQSATDNSGIVAKDIEAHRMKFAGAPAFDPSPVLPPTTRTWYQRPLTCAMPVEEYLDQIPHVQVRGRRQEVLKLLHALDATARLSTFEESEVRPRVKSGMFALMKNLEVDRLILDCRPANCLEYPLSEYTQCMASPSPILDMVLRPGFTMKAAGEDLKDCYYY